MYCPNCGKELPEGTKFCIECGTKLETEQIETVNTFAEEVEAVGEEVVDTVTDIEKHSYSPVREQPESAQPTPANTVPPVTTNPAPANTSFEISSNGKITTGKKGRTKFKDLSPKQNAIRFGIGGLLILIGLILIIVPTVLNEYSNNSSVLDETEVTPIMSDEQAVSALYATSAFKGDSSYEIAVQYGSIKDVSIGNALDYMFQNPNVTCEAGNDCVYVTVSGMYSINGSQHSSASITYKVDSNFNVSVHNDTYGISDIVTQWATYLASR